MRIEPKRPTKKVRPWAILSPGYRCLGLQSSDGSNYRAEGPNRCYELLKKYENHTLYTLGSLGPLRLATGARCWQATVWRGRITSIALDGTKVKVSSLRGVLADSREPFLALSKTMEWLSDLGVNPGSLSSMAWSLWRSTLTDPLSIAFAPKVGRAALYGGRQEIREARTFSHMKSIDITAAYPHSMSLRPFASTLMEVDKTTTIDPDRAGIAQARVMVDPEMRNAPLPIRVGPEMIQWQRGMVEGTWSWCELEAAQSLGCSVEVLRSWAPVREVSPFSSWWNLILEGRQLPDGGSKIVKAISSSLWGLFGMVGDDRGIVRWADDFGNEPVFIAQERKTLPHAQTAHIAAETAARVRRRMLLEGMSGPYSPVHVDTDGIIIRKSAPMPADSGDAPGQWRKKESMVKVEIRAPQVYRYRCADGCGVIDGHPDYHYVTAGVRHSEAAELFDRSPKTKIAIYGRDMVLPDGLSYDLASLDKYRQQAELVHSATYGRASIGAR